MNIKRRILLSLLSLILIVNVGFVSEAQGKNVDDMKQQQQQNNKKIDDLKDKKGDLQGEKDKLLSDIEDLSSKILAQSKIVNEKNQGIMKVQNNIDNLQNKISDIEMNTEKLQSDIVNLQEDKKKKEELLGKRIRGMYKQNPYDNMLLFILESTNFSDLISRLDGLSRIVKSDKKLIQEAEDAKKALEDTEKKLVEERKILQDEKLALDSQKQKLVEENSVYEKELNSLKAIENEKNSKRDALNSEEKKIYNQILALEESNDKLQSDIENFLSSVNNGSTGTVTPSNSSFIYPVNASITSPFGYRTHPVSGQQKLHTGTDFGAGSGTPVKASKEGKVVYSGSYGGYGNTVIIDHGGGIQTLYAHNSRLAVSNGQTVKQGQVVSYVGSTGVSTGPHLHFEVRVNGTPQDPMGYLK